MDHDFWAQRWDQGAIGFHKESTNDVLLRYGPKHFPPRGRILVPLCGKSLDLGWLVEQGFDVVGVEFVEKAVVDLFRERGWTPSVEPAAWGEIWRGPGVTILRADVFDVSFDAIGPVGGIWDRAAFIALEPDQRPRYAALLCRWIDAGAVLLLNVVDYEPKTFEGPPFCVTRGEVEALFANLGLELLEVRNEPVETQPRWKDRGVTRVTDTTWKVAAG